MKPPFLNTKSKRFSTFSNRFSKILCQCLQLFVCFRFFSGIVVEGTQYTIPFKYPVEPCHWASNLVSKETMKWIQLPPSNGSGTFSPNTDGQELRMAEEHHLVEKWCLLGSLDVSGTQHTEEGVCRTLLSHFCFWRSKANYFFSNKTQHIIKESLLFFT